MPSAPRLRQAAEALAGALPPLLVAGRARRRHRGAGRARPAAGRAWARRSGSSASYRAGDARRAIDWRQSAQVRHLFVREQEWEAAESVWIWRDRRPRWTSAPARAADQMGTCGPADAGADRLAGARRRAGGPAGQRRARRPRADTASSRSPAPWPRPPRSVPVAPLPALPRHARLDAAAPTFSAPIDRLRERFAQFAGSGRSSLPDADPRPCEELLPYEGRVMFEGTEHGRQRADRPCVRHPQPLCERCCSARASLARHAGRQGCASRRTVPTDRGTALLASNGASGDRVRD